MNPLRLQIQTTTNEELIVDVDLNQFCPKTGKHLSSAVSSHNDNKIPRPYVLAIAQDHSSRVQCFDGIAFSLASEEEKRAYQARFKHIYYLRIRDWKQKIISLIDHAPEETALAYATFSYATSLSQKVVSARKSLVEHHERRKEYAKVLEFLTLNIDEYQHRIRDINQLILAGKILCEGEAGIEKDFSLGCKYFQMALEIDKRNAEANALLGKYKKMLPQGDASPPTHATPEPASLDSTRSLSVNSNASNSQPLTPASSSSLDPLSPIAENPQSAASSSSSRASLPTPLTLPKPAEKKCAMHSSPPLANNQASSKKVDTIYRRKRSHSAPPFFKKKVPALPDLFADLIKSK